MHAKRRARLAACNQKSTSLRKVSNALSIFLDPPKNGPWLVRESTNFRDLGLLAASEEDLRIQDQMPCIFHMGSSLVHR